MMSVFCFFKGMYRQLKVFYNCFDYTIDLVDLDHQLVGYDSWNRPRWKKSGQSQIDLKSWSFSEIVSSKIEIFFIFLVS